MSCRRVLFALSMLLLAQAAVAGDSPFGYVYTTDTHQKGKREFEQWITQRHGQSQGDFDLWQLRSEIEYGALLTYALVLVPAAWLAISAFKVHALKVRSARA